MTTERKAKQLNKRYERGVENVARKIVKAGARQTALIELGKTVIVTEKDGVKTYDFPPTASVTEPSIPRLSWIGGKTYKQQGDSRKLRSGRKPEHTEAIPEDASRTFAKEVAKALMPPVPITDPARLLPEHSTTEGLGRE